MVVILCLLVLLTLPPLSSVVEEVEDVNTQALAPLGKGKHIFNLNINSKKKNLIFH